MDIKGVTDEQPPSIRYEGEVGGHGGTGHCSGISSVASQFLCSPIMGFRGRSQILGLSFYCSADKRG